MKKNLKSILAIAVIATGVIAVSMYSCEKENIQPNDSTEEQVELKDINTVLPDVMSLCGKITKIPLIENETGNDVGSAYVYNNKEYLWVVLNTRKGFYMKKAFMDIVENEKDLPTNFRTGMLDYEKFKYLIDAEPASNIRTFKVPVGDARNKSIYSIMVKIRKKGEFKYMKDAWVEGKITFKGGGRAFNHVVDRCRPDFEDPEFEPANPPMQQETAAQDEIRNNKKPRVE
jgi:hypothetical protein